MHCAYRTSLVGSEPPPPEAAGAEPGRFDPPPQPATASPSAASATGSPHRQPRHDPAGDLPPMVARIVFLMLTSLASFHRGWTLRWSRCAKRVVTPRSERL